MSLLAGTIRDVGHGTQWYYRQGCRCTECSAAHATEARKYRVNRLDHVRARDRAYRAEHIEVARARDRLRYQEPERRAYTKAKAAEYYAANREEAIKRATIRQKANPEGRRRTHLKRQYGITPEVYEAMYSAQVGRCGICSESHKRLAVDHDHADGHVRGLLCRRCNAAIGSLHDDPALLRRALSWLEDN